MVRKPIAASVFYPADGFYPAAAAALRKLVGSLVPPVAAAPRPAVPGIIVPHAGYQFSGAVAGAVYARVAVPSLVVMLGPKHTRAGSSFSAWATGAWRTPLGEVPVSPRAADLLAASAMLEEDFSAHLGEHSLEVQLPFLQVCGPPGLAVIPIALGSDDPAALAALGEELAAFVRAVPEPVLLLASSDMSHFESEQRARQKDRLALDAVCALDPEQLLETVCAHDISMCGAAPAAALLFAGRKLGTGHPELVAYDTSAATTGDRSRVVGYAGLVLPAGPGKES